MDESSYIRNYPNLSLTFISGGMEKHLLPPVKKVLISAINANAMSGVNLYLPVNTLADTSKGLEASRNDRRLRLRNNAYSCRLRLLILHKTPSMGTYGPFTDQGEVTTWSVDDWN